MAQRTLRPARSGSGKTGRSFAIPIGCWLGASLAQSARDGQDRWLVLEGDARERRRLLLGWELKVSASRGKDGVATVKMEVQEGSHLGHCWWAGWVWKRAAHVAQSAAIEAKWRHMKRGAPQLAVKMAVQS